MTATTTTAEAPGRHELRRLGSGSALNLGSALVAQLLTFATIALLGHAFGASAVGIYSEAFAVRALVALLCLGGMRNAMTRYVAAFRAERNPGAVRGTVRIGIVSAVGLSAIATIVLLLVTPTLAADAFGEPALERGLLYASWSLIPATVTIVSLSATQGFQTMRAYAFIGSILDAGVRLVFVVIGVALGGLEMGLLGLLVSSLLTMFASLIALQRLMHTLDHAPPEYHYGEITRYSAYSWLASVANQGLLWADTVILGLYLPSREVGVYQVSTRAVLLATLAVVPLTASFAPLAADFWHRRAVLPLQRVYQATAEWLVRISFPPLLVVAVFAGTMLRVFGSGFSGGVIVIQIFAAGSLIDVWASAAGVTLNMSGFNKLNMLDTVAVLVLNVGLNVLLIPHFGIVGSVWAWTIALGAYGIVRVVQVDKLVLHVLPISYRSRETFFAAVPATIVALAVRVLLGDTFGGLVVGGALTLGVYVLVLARFGLRAEDRELFARGREPEAPPGPDTLPASTSAPIPTVGSGSYREWRRTVNASLTSTSYRVLPRYRRPESPVPLRTLISPLRADILVRADFFDFVEDEARAGALDIDRIVRGARELPYFEWFRSVAVAHIGIDEVQLDEAFSTRVRRSFQLWEQYTRNGFDSRRPILLTWSDVVRTASGKELSGRYQPLDGCHRIALLWRSGVAELQPNECWAQSTPSLAIDNTAELLRRLSYADTDYVRYLALGMIDGPVQDLDDLFAKVRAQSGEQEGRRLERIVAIDRATDFDRV